MPMRPGTYRPTSKGKPDANRGTARQRGYGTAWDKRRKTWLREQWEAVTDPMVKAKLPNCLPPCVDCLARGVVTEANQVDHDEPHRGDMAKFWIESNWRARCVSCHSRKTARGL